MFDVRISVAGFEAGTTAIEMANLMKELRLDKKQWSHGVAAHENAGQPLIEKSLWSTPFPVSAVKGLLDAGHFSLAFIGREHHHW